MDFKDKRLKAKDVHAHDAAIISTRFAEKCKAEKRSACKSSYESFVKDMKRYFQSSMNDCQLISIIKQFLQATETLNLSRNITNDVNASRDQKLVAEETSNQSLFVTEIIQSFSNELIDFAGLKEVLEKGIQSDVTVVVGNEQFFAHKDILCARSHYFNAMLQVNSRWKETVNSTNVTLNDVSPRAFAVFLCHMYGIFATWDCGANEATYSLVQIADMFGVDDFKYVVSFCLQKDLCHFFHKPCSGCMDGVVFTLLVSDQFNIPSLFDKCMKWSIKHMVRVWPSREFSQLPNETHQRILLATIKSLNLPNVVSTTLNIDKTLGRLPEVNWAKSVAALLKNVWSHCLNYMSDCLSQLTSSKKINPLFEGMNFKRSIVEELGETLISTLSPSNACNRYISVQKLLDYAQNDFNWSPEVAEIMTTIQDRVWHYLLANCYSVMFADDWSEFPEEKRKLLTENSINLGEPTRKLKQKPVLSSSKIREGSRPEKSRSATANTRQYPKKQNAERKSTVTKKKLCSIHQKPTKNSKVQNDPKLSTSNNSCSTGSKTTRQASSMPSVESITLSNLLSEFALQPLEITEELQDDIDIPPSRLTSYNLQHRPSYLRF